MTNTSLLISLSLVGVALALTYYQRLGLERDIIVGTVRALVQLTLVGYLLAYVFQLTDWRLTTLILATMIFVAGHHTSTHGKKIPRVLFLSTASIGLGTIITLLLLVLLNLITYRPWEIIPIGGMILGNTMVATSIALSQLKSGLSDKVLELETALSLGATSRQAVEPILKSSIKAGMIPTIANMKTLGIVQLPGMMTGLILAGADPLEAVRYQLLVMFMISSSTAISCMSVSLLAYRQFFTDSHQLLRL